MRPRSIVLFEQLFLASLAVSLVPLALGYGAATAAWNNDPNVRRVGLGSSFLIGAMVFDYAVYLLLWFLVARKASNIAKWILRGRCLEPHCASTGSQGALDADDDPRLGGLRARDRRADFSVQGRRQGLPERRCSRRPGGVRLNLRAALAALAALVPTAAHAQAY